MKKVVYYASSAVCGYISLIVMKESLTANNLPMHVRIITGAVGASMGVGGYACVKEAQRKDDD